jgi:hypothetical protein
MRAVIEEFLENTARLIPDNHADELVLNRQDLPEDCKVGDVVNILIKEGKVVEVTVLPYMKEKRLEENQKKREQLLKRTQKKRMEENE